MHYSVCNSLRFIFTRVIKGVETINLPEAGHVFEIRVEKDVRLVYRAIQRLLSAYKDEKRGPTYIAVQSAKDFPHLISNMPGLGDFPMVPIHVNDE